MSDSTWIPQVELPDDAVLARTGRQLSGQTAYLKTRVDQAEFGQAVFARDVTLDPDLLEGQPVYWNDENQRFEAALAGVETDALSNSLVPTPASDCLGIVYVKEFANKGTLLLFGYATLDITNAVGSATAAGRYYLSASEPGQLVVQRPPATVSVLYADGHGKVFVQPTTKNFVEDHVHFSFDLTCRPAGTSEQPSVGDRHAIADPDSTLPGWLPASHSSFRGLAPARAAFGYNLAAHPELQRVWPPLPVSAAAFVLDRGNNLVGGTQVPLGSDGLIVADRSGIWWMSDCYGDVPWPTATNTAKSSYPSEPSSSASADGECPRFEKMRLIASFVRMAFATDKSVVTTLQPADGSPIRFVDCDGEPATTGDLFAQFETDFLVSNDDTDGNLAIKELDGNRFKRGYVVQGVLSGNDNLTVTGTRTKTIGEKEYAQGLIELTVNLDPVARDLPVHLVRLDDVKERHYQDIMYLGFPANQISSIRSKIKIPGAGLPASPKVKLRAQILGRSAGTLPAMALSYRILIRPTTGSVALPVSDTALTFSVPQAITTDKYVEVESAAFDVAAGDTILLSVTRSVDGYTGEVGLLDLVGILFAGG